MTRHKILKIMKIIAKCDNAKNKQNGISIYDTLSAGSLFLLV